MMLKTIYYDAQLCFSREILCSKLCQYNVPSPTHHWQENHENLTRKLMKPGGGKGSGSWY